MIINSLCGKVLFSTNHKALKPTLEQAAIEGADLAFADFRKARLCNASLDGLNAAGASFWGADLSGSDLGMADLRFCDLRAGNLADTCFAESDLNGADLRGAYFSRTLFEGTVLSGAKVSCPSFWGCDLSAVRDMSGLRYAHRGENDIVVNECPLILCGGAQRIVLFEDYTLSGTKLHGPENLPVNLEKMLFCARTRIERKLFGQYSHPAHKPIPKIKRKPASV